MPVSIDVVSASHQNANLNSDEIDFEMYFVFLVVASLMMPHCDSVVKSTMAIITIAPHAALSLIQLLVRSKVVQDLQLTI